MLGLELADCNAFNWVIPNCQFRSKTARLKTFTANQIDEIKDPSGLFYILPFQKGYLVNWDVQRQVWDYLFGKEMYQVTNWS